MQRRGRRAAVAMALAIGLAAITGCQPRYVKRAERDYREGRYLEVAEELARHEDEVATMTRKQQAHYGLYRGLSLLKLGDYDGASQWFSFVEKVQLAGPTLDATKAQWLQDGRAELAAMLKFQRGGGTADGGGAADGQPAPSTDE